MYRGDPARRRTCAAVRSARLCFGREKRAPRPRERPGAVVLSFAGRPGTRQGSPDPAPWCGIAPLTRIPLPSHAAAAACLATSGPPAIRHPPRRALSVSPDTTGTAPRPARHVAPRPGSRHAGRPAGAGSLPRLGGPPGRQLYASPPRATTKLAYRCLCDASTDYAAALQRGTGAASICRFHTPGSSSRPRRLWRPLCAGHLTTASSRWHQRSS